MKKAWRQLIEEWSAMRATCLGIAGLLAASPSSFACNDDGHYYTILAAMYESESLAARNTRDEEKLLAFCAQMPDLAEELEAVTLRIEAFKSFSGWAWGMFTVCPSEQVQHMATVHHYLHGLTGLSDASPDAVTAAANKVVERLMSHRKYHTNLNVLCAAGLGLHLLGDSFAHRQLNDESEMYAAGMGHFSAGHRPDYIGITQQRQGWWQNKYLPALRSLIDLAKPDPDPIDVAGAYDQNKTETYRSRALRDILAKEDRPLWIYSQMNPNDSPANSDDPPPKPFDAVMRKAFPAYSEINYLNVWGTFKKAVVDQFGQTIPAACSPDNVGTAIEE
jgi:hypothetical protein